MSRLTLFNSPLPVGVSIISSGAASTGSARFPQTGYPPYNIEQLGGRNALRITLAVAGFLMSDLSITVEDNQLVIRGKQADDTEARLPSPRQSRARQFPAFVCSRRRYRSDGAWLDNGLLHIDLVRPEVQSRVRAVEIQSGSTSPALRRAPVGSGP